MITVCIIPIEYPIRYAIGLSFQGNDCMDSWRAETERWPFYGGISSVKMMENDGNWFSRSNDEILYEILYDGDFSLEDHFDGS